MTLNAAYPLRSWSSAGLDERVQLSGTPSRTNCLHQESLRRGRVKTGVRPSLEEYIADINRRLLIAKVSNSMNRAL